MTGLTLTEGQHAGDHPGDRRSRQRRHDDRAAAARHGGTDAWLPRPRRRHHLHRHHLGPDLRHRGGPGICGTAADGTGSGVATVTYELRKSGLLGGNYQCWNGNAWASGQCGKDQDIDSGPSPWRSSVPTNSMPNGFILSIQMRLVLTVTDVAGNEATLTINFAKN